MPDKLEGPTICLVFLGILLIDTICMKTSLTCWETSEELLADLQSWPYSKICLKRVLLFLTGKLNLTCCIISAGCIFLCHLIDLSMTARMPHCHITLMNVEVCWDIAWLLKLLSTWNVCTITPDAYRSRSPCTPGTLHRCIWYPWLWYLLYRPLYCRQPSSHPTGLLHKWSFVCVIYGVVTSYT